VKGTVTATAESTKTAQEQASEQAHFNAIRAVHPDYEQVAASGEFHGWLDRQPATYRIILFGDGIETSPYQHGGGAKEVIGVFDHYKRLIGAARRDEDAANVAAPSIRKARTTQPKGRRTFTREEINNMPPAEFAALEAEIDAAMAEGRIT
jgi:hypothetical protein